MHTNHYITYVVSYMYCTAIYYKKYMYIKLLLLKFNQGDINCLTPVASEQIFSYIFIWLKKVTLWRVIDHEDAYFAQDQNAELHFNSARSPKQVLM